MSVLLLLVPLALALGLCFLAGFLFAARGGQLRDLETPAYRALLEDLPETSKGNEDADRA